MKTAKEIVNILKGIERTTRNNIAFYNDIMTCKDTSLNTEIEKRNTIYRDFSTMAKNQLKLVELVKIIEMCETYVIPFNGNVDKKVIDDINYIIGEYTDALLNQQISIHSTNEIYNLMKVWEMEIKQDLRGFLLKLVE